MAVVLVTRPQDGAARTTARIRALGHEAIIAPVLEIHPEAPEHLFAADVPQHLVFTSAAAPAAIARHRDLSRLTNARIWVVGARTAEAVRAIGFEVHDVAPDFARLVILMADEVPPGARILHLAGENRTGDLGQALGRAVEIAEVYRAEIVPELDETAARRLEAGEIHAVLHFSQRSASAFFALADRARIGARAAALTHVCIAPGVAEIATAKGAREVHTASAPDEDAMINLIAMHLR